jgi:hypothetical protein
MANNPLLEAIRNLGTIVDTPRAAAWAGARSLANQENPLPGMMEAIVDPESRISGEDLTGDPYSGMVAEIAGDPLNWLGLMGVVKGLKKVRGLPGENLTAKQLSRVRKYYPHASEEDVHKMAFGDTQEVADALSRMETGMRKPAIPLDDAAWMRRSGERTGVRSYEMPRAGSQRTAPGYEDAPSGFVFPPRTDVAIASGTPATFSHENMHVIQHKYPELSPRMVDDLGEMVSPAIDDYSFSPEAARSLIRSRGLKSMQDEGVANIVERAVTADDGGYEFVKALQDNTPIQNLADRIRNAYPGVETRDPGNVAQIVNDFYSGKLNRSRSLVPAGPVRDVPKSRLIQAILAYNALRADKNG